MIKINLSIAAVAAETGIAKEVLRKWEIRYGFPVPSRDDIGNRVYSENQASRLKLIKRLLDAGMRPGKVVPLDEAALQALLSGLQADAALHAQKEAAPPVIAWLCERDPGLLHDKLKRHLEQVGIAHFVQEALPVMNQHVGQAWADQRIAIRDEHLYTEIVQRLLRDVIDQHTDASRRPRVLLTTPSGELHTLGLLMAQTSLSLAGAYCVSLGAQSPVPEILMAVSDFDIDILALSFSTSFPVRKIYPLLKEIRADLPGQIEIWIGGAAVAALPKMPRGVRAVPRLAELATELQRYAARAKAQDGTDAR